MRIQVVAKVQAESIRVDLHQVAVQEAAQNVGFVPADGVIFVVIETPSLKREEWRVARICGSKKIVVK